MHSWLHSGPGAKCENAGCTADQVKNVHSWLHSGPGFPEPAPGAGEALNPRVVDEIRDEIRLKHFIAPFPIAVFQTARVQLLCRSLSLSRFKTACSNSGVLAAF